MLPCFAHSTKAFQYANPLIIIQRLKHLEPSQTHPRLFAPTANMGQANNRGREDRMRLASRIPSSLAPHESSELSEAPESAEASNTSEPPRRSGRMRTPSSRLDVSESQVMSRQNMNSVAPSPARIQTTSPKPANLTTGQC